MTDKTLESIIKRRFYDHKKTAERLGKTPPKIEDIKTVFVNAFNDGFRCCYCGTKLEFHTPYPYFASPSLDHKTSLWGGGDNQLENLVVCCARCNIFKGTMGYDTAKKVISLLIEKGVYKKASTEMFHGRLAQKLYERNPPSGSC